jgi:APA family basic amino acid/polyamine antiporter
VAVAFAEYLRPLFDLPAVYVRPMAVAILIGLACFHALGIKPGAILINIITFGKTLAIVALVISAFALTAESGVGFDTLTPPGMKSVTLVSAFFAALVPVMFSYGGWQNLNFVSEEVREPLRNLPRAIMIGVWCVIAVYDGANVAYVHVLGADSLAATTTPAATAAAQLAGDAGAKAISLLIVVSTFGFINLALLSAPRVYYAMGADGVFFGFLGKLSPRFHAPTAAILLQGALAAFFALFNPYEKLLDYAVLADWIFFSLAGVALMVFRRTLPDAPRPQPVPLYPLTPILFILVGLGIVINTFITGGLMAALVGLIIAAGVPVFYLWKRFGAARAEEVKEVKL